jgi:hypothetical protein
MEANDILRRVIGAVRNAVVWGGAWGVLASAIGATVRLADGIPLGIAIGDGIVTGARFGFVGGATGAAFAVFISLFYRGRRVSQISWARFAVGGAVVAGLFLPAFLLTANLLSGDGFPVMSDILDDVPLAALFGGLTAAGSIWLAQRGAALPAGARPARLGASGFASSSGITGAAPATSSRRATD